MKRVLILSILVLAVFISGCDSEVEKCENSGGHWVNACETGECYECWCHVENKNSSPSAPSTFRVLKNGMCTDCQEDGECGESKCGMMMRYTCYEEKVYCEGGLCVREYNTYGSGEKNHLGFDMGPASHECVNNECVPL
jgi:hypothetical protein